MSCDWEASNDRFLTNTTFLYTTEINCVHLRSPTIMQLSLPLPSSSLTTTTLSVLLSRADSMAYTFGDQSGVLYYSFPATHRRAADSDRLAFGFSSTQRHATVISVSSYRRNDVIRVDLASHVTIRERKCMSPYLYARLSVSLSVCLSVCTSVCQSAQKVMKLDVNITVTVEVITD